MEVWRLKVAFRVRVRWLLFKCFLRQLPDKIDVSGIVAGAVIQDDGRGCTLAFQKAIVHIRTHLAGGRGNDANPSLRGHQTKCRLDFPDFLDFSGASVVFLEHSKNVIGITRPWRKRLDAPT